MILKCMWYLHCLFTLCGKDDPPTGIGSIASSILGDIQDGVASVVSPLLPKDDPGTGIGSILGDLEDKKLPFVDPLLPQQEGHAQIDLPVGSIMGKREVTAEGTPFYSYMGIPYAEPPVGKRRFQAPVEKAPWSGVRDATTEGSRCYQMQADNSKASEDCLVINVFTPEAPRSEAALPVMVWIYGGGFVQGYASAQIFGADHLMDKNVILVTFNYRIGPYGFLSFGDLVLPGNAGLKDQNLALKWTNKYIGYFGGDVNKITLFGQSAGAASVSHHLLSPKSSGLFGAAILQSGTSVTPWSVQPRLPLVSHRLAQKINETEYNKWKDSSSKLLAYLQSLPVDVIQNATDEDFPDMALPQYSLILDGFYFTPTIELEHEGAFITEPMFERLENGKFEKVPIIIGFNTLEWSALQFIPGFSEVANFYDDNITLVVPHDMNTKPENLLAAATRIYNFYTQGTDFKTNQRHLLEYYSDQGLSKSVRKYAEIASKYTDVYFYQFAYKGTLNGASEPVIGHSEDVSHTEELRYLFSAIYNNINAKNWSNINPIDKTTGERMTTLWTNFATFRHPTPSKMDILQNLTWPKYGTESAYLDIGSYLEIKQRPKDKMYTMWEGAVSQWGTKPFVTY